MLYCQDLSLALFDQGGGEGSPTLPLRPLGPHSSLIPQLLFREMLLGPPWQPQCSAEEFRHWELLGLTFALPPASCSGWVGGEATSSSPRTCLHSPGRALLPSSPAVGPEHPPLRINPGEPKLSPRPLVGYHPGAGQRVPSLPGLGGAPQPLSPSALWPPGLQEEKGGHVEEAGVEAMNAEFWAAWPCLWL